MPTRAALAAAYREKFPRYKDVPDDQLVEAILAKNPVYKDQLTDAYVPGEGERGATERALARSANPLLDTTHPRGEAPSEPGTFSGGFFKSIKDQVVKATAKNPVAEGAAHPSSAGDVASLLLPTAPGASAGPKAAGEMLKRTHVHPGALLDFKLNQPLRTLKEIVSIDPKPHTYTPPVPPNTSALDMSFRPNGYTPTKPSPVKSPMDMVRLAGKAPTLDEALTEALTGAMGGEKPSLVSSHPPLETVGEGALKQSGKFGKSGSMGQPGGYSSGRPAISDVEYEKMLQKFGGKEQTPFHSTADPEWHSGAEPGSAEAGQANKMHKAEGEMSADYTRKMDDPLASFLITALLGGGSAGALMSSHEAP